MLGKDNCLSFLYLTRLSTDHGKRTLRYIDRQILVAEPKYNRVASIFGPPNILPINKMLKRDFLETSKIFEVCLHNSLLAILNSVTNENFTCVRLRVDTVTDVQTSSLLSQNTLISLVDEILNIERVILGIFTKCNQICESLYFLLKI